MTSALPISHQKVNGNDNVAKNDNRVSSYHPNYQHYHYPLRHQDHVSHRIPFLTVFNPRQDDPLSHYHEIAHELHESIMPAVSLLKKILAPPSSPENGVGEEEHIRKDGRKVVISMDVHQFTPEELTINMKGDELVIEGKHEEKHDGHGFISRSVTRRIHFPANMDSNEINCDVGSDGILEISIPQKGDFMTSNDAKRIAIHYNAKPVLTNGTTDPDAAPWHQTANGVVNDARDNAALGLI